MMYNFRLLSRYLRGRIDKSGYFNNDMCLFNKVSAVLGRRTIFEYLQLAWADFVAIVKRTSTETKFIKTAISPRRRTGDLV
jgi:hypothetical protein